MPTQESIIVGIATAVLVALWWLVLIRPFVRQAVCKVRAPLWAVWNAEAAIVIWVASTYVSERLGFFASVELPILPSSSLVSVVSAWQEPQVLAAPELAGAAVALLVLGALWGGSPRARRHAMLLAVPAGIISGVVTGEAVSRCAMSAAASSIGADCVVRHSFRESINIGTAEKPAPKLHAFAIAHGVKFGWSYTEQRFFPLPDYMAEQTYALERKCRSQMRG